MRVLRRLRNLLTRQEVYVPYEARISEEDIEGIPVKEDFIQQDILML